jgi:hypothetical protein
MLGIKGEHVQTVRDSEVGGVDVAGSAPSTSALGLLAALAPTTT